MTETIAIIDYGSGNLRSVQKALQRAAAAGSSRAEVTLVRDADALAAADRLVLPGVGAFAACMDGLVASGMRDALTDAVERRGVPFLGICVGMQLLADRGLEFGETKGLGWIGGDVRRLPDAPGVRTPHMGWNTVSIIKQHPIFETISGPTDFYFAHSFYFDAQIEPQIFAHCDYGGPFPVVVGRDTMVACQFHPEKSQAAGLRVLEGFLSWRP